MKIIFFGTPQFVLPILESLYKEYNRGSERNLIGVVTQSPKQYGRQKILSRSAVDNWAYKHKIPLIFEVSKIPEADLGIIAAYGEILPEETIRKFKFGILNIHPSLLPKFRGASPIQATIATGETPGVTIIKMDKLMDHGPIVSYFKDELKEDDTNESLRNRLFERSAKFLIDLIPNYLNGKIRLKEQDQKSATYTRLIKKEDGFIPPSILDAALSGKISDDKWEIGFIKNYIPTPDSDFLDRFTKSVNPWPGTWTFVKIENQFLRLKILSTHKDENSLILDEVQLEGKKPVTWKQFESGYPNYSFDVPKHPLS